MATKIRLKRIGRRNRPFYRIIIIDSRKRRDGSAIEQVGWYNPIESNKEKNYVLKEDRILEWLKLGAQVTDPVNKLMKRSGLAYRWHLIKQGLSEIEIDKAVEEWKKERDKVIQDRIKAIKDKKEKLKAEKAAAKVAEEAPAEEASVEETPAEEAQDEAPAEEASVEETPAEEAKEETPAEEASVEETPAEEAKEETPAEKAKEETPAEEAQD
ncbi:MAG: 30S ribosomal protein S16, partial [Candidatus Marinimicrobia bacterium]|nr:30S ribosomal protein S16 [Candidatus Neomarinimicrobiota bacterium]